MNKKAIKASSPPGKYIHKSGYMESNTIRVFEGRWSELVGLTAGEVYTYLFLLGSL